MAVPRPASTVVSVLALAGCGGSRAPGVVVPADSGSFFEGGPPSDVKDPCDGGYFIEIDDDAGHRRLTGGCSDAGADVPSAANLLCGEDCVCTVIAACDGLASFSFHSACWVCGVGSCSVRTTYSDAEGGTGVGVASLDIARFPRDGGTVEGQFTGTLTVVDDGGFRTGAPVSGRFCVLYSR